MSQNDPGSPDKNHDKAAMDYKPDIVAVARVVIIDTTITTLAIMVLIFVAFTILLFLQTAPEHQSTAAWKLITVSEIPSAEAAVKLVASSTLGRMCSWQELAE